MNDDIKVSAAGADYDLTSNSWGHALYAVNQNDDGSWRCTGCLTPLPRPGSTALMADNKVWRFRSVAPCGNPRDGFSAVIEKA